MKPNRLMKIIRAPRISEKSTMLADKYAQHVFSVHHDANKLEVKKAVELLFGVKVRQVRILNVSGKSKMHGRKQGRRSDWKKAYVALESGNDIDYGMAER